MNRKAVLGALAVATLTLTGCGGTSMPPPAPPSAAQAAPAPHNDADITFATGMVLHHAQAVEMSQLASDRASAPQVKQLAADIAKAQGPEIVQLQGFLGAWSQPTAATGGMEGMDGMAGMDHGSSGMMTAQQMQQLQNASGAAFDRLWLQMMIEHHTGAITMARAELDGGANTDAKALAQKIVDAQQAEIATMKQLLTP